MLRIALSLLAATWLLPGIARAQFLPERGPSGEQQEFAAVVLLGPEATVLGGFLGGGIAYLTTKECCTERGDEVDVVPMAIGAGVGAFIASAWAIHSICDRAHPGSRRNLMIGAALGSGIGAGLVFGGPQGGEDPNDAILRVLGALFLPSIAAWSGWHVDSNSMYYLQQHAPRHAIAATVGPARTQALPLVPSIALRF